MSEEPKLTKLEEVIRIIPQIEAGLNIVIVGAGGNGSHLLANLLRYVAFMPAEIRKRLDIKVVDFDLVEQKNISRQLFVAGDVGQFKADALVSRYGRNFGIPSENLGSVTEKLSSPDDMVKLMSRLYTNLVIDCTDNRTARRFIYEGVVKATSIADYAYNYILSAGNGAFSGQVGFGGFERVRGSVHLQRRIPVPYAFYPEMIDADLDKAEEGLSCAEQAALNMQSIGANVVASSLLLIYALKFLHNLAAIQTGEKLQSIPTGMIHFNTEDLSFSQMRLVGSYLDVKNPRIGSGKGDLYVS